MAGSFAGTNHTTGYWAISIDNRRYYSHRLAWFYVHREWPPADVDHINGDKGDNRLCNLRAVSVVVNAQNRKAHQSNNKLGFLGVTAHEHKFRATIVVDGKQVSLGRYNTAEEAHDVYLAKRREVFPGNTI